MRIFLEVVFLTFEQLLKMVPKSIIIGSIVQEFKENVN